MQRVLIILVVWALIYLPALGSLEIKGEEGRRILPAVTMLETGNVAPNAREWFRSYIVPQVGSEPYFRKPPLINWLVAASFKLTGVKSEWTARIPSALCVLGAAFVFLVIAVPTLGSRGSLLAALMWLTSFGIIEKGRLIEIEGLYVSLYAIAFVCWFSGWLQRRSPWLTWLVPLIVLGFGILAKGPLHLVFFYGIVVAILWRQRQLRELLRAPHVVGIGLMLAIFLAWAVPCLVIASAGDVTTIWSRQFAGRLRGESFHLASWLMNIPRGLGYFLPWLVFVPCIGIWRIPDERGVYRALALSTAVLFVAVNLIPGSLPRYSMPLIAPAIWLTSAAFASSTLRLPKLLGAAAITDATARRIATAFVVITCGAMLIYAIAIVPRLGSRQKIRTVAAQIDAVVPRDQLLVAIDPQYQPYLFYVQAPIRYVSDADDAPVDASFLLARHNKRSDVEESQRWAPRHAHGVLQIKDYRGQEATVFKIE